MFAEYWQRGESIDYKNASSEIIKAGDVVSLDTRIGVAGCDILPGAVGSLHVTGVFIVPKASGALTVGAAAYFDAASKNFTATETGNVPAGWVVVEAQAADTVAKIKIG